MKIQEKAKKLLLGKYTILDKYDIDVDEIIGNAKKSHKNIIFTMEKQLNTKLENLKNNHSIYDYNIIVNPDNSMTINIQENMDLTYVNLNIRYY